MQKFKLNNYVHYLDSSTLLKQNVIILRVYNYIY
jgi:hypothetical protein